MIKLIATDMDGTLLDENSNLPKDFFEVLDKLNKNNIKFVIASGRSYPVLHDMFEEKLDKLQFICDNGAYIVDDTGTSIEFMSREDVRNIVNDCRKIGDLKLVMCGAKGIYVEKMPAKFNEEVNIYYPTVISVDDLGKVDDDIFKISVCDEKNSKENSYKILEPIYGQSLNVTVSGEIWLDFTDKGINKGYALKKIQEDFDIAPEETMVFGDFYNDIEMLKRAKYSFVMENANNDMKKYGNYIAKSNKEYGVIKAIEEYIFEEKK